MIKEYKLDKLNKSIIKTDARKKKQNSNAKANAKAIGNVNANGNANAIGNANTNRNVNKKTKKKIQKGGNANSKDKFEVTTLDNVNYKNFSVSRYVNANIDWGVIPNAPPLDCCIM